MTVRNKNQNKSSRTLRKVFVYVLAYALLVGGIGAILSWDDVSTACMPISVIAGCGLLAGGLALGYIDRKLVRRLKQ